MLGGFKEAERVGILDYYNSSAYKDIWEEYANGEWRQNFWQLWQLKESHGAKVCSMELPDQVLEMGIWKIRS